MPFLQHNRLDLTVNEKPYNTGCIEVPLLSFIHLKFFLSGKTKDLLHSDLGHNFLPLVLNPHVSISLD